MVNVDPNDLVYLLGAKEAEIFTLRRENGQLKGTVAELEREILRLRDLTGDVSRAKDDAPPG